MKKIWKNQFIVWNIIALIFVKGAFSYSGSQFAALLNGATAFSKEEVITQTNVLRQTFGLGGLKENGALDIAAAQKLQDMIQNQYFAHVSPLGISPWHWFDTNQYKYSYAGENLAIGFLTAKDTVDAWANSPSHRANLLNSNYKEIGLAVAPAKIQNSEGFLVVQLFGTSLPAAPVKTVARNQPSPAPLAVPAATAPALLASPAVQSASQENPEKPIISEVGGVNRNLKKTAGVFNFAFTLYALIIFLVCLTLLAFYGLKKSLAIRTAASFATLLLAIALPVFQITHTALIL